MFICSAKVCVLQNCSFLRDESFPGFVVDLVQFDKSSCGSRGSIIVEPVETGKRS